MTMQATAPADLAELMRAFNEVTARLERTHEDLRAQVASLHDELRAANEQLARSQRLAALGEVAAGIAHEVRNPLASIGLDARLLREDLGGRGAELAGRIERAVRQADGIVNDVLAFAREIRLRPAALDGGEVMASAMSACSAFAEGVAIEAMPIAGAIPLEADGALLRQALVNVIRNAVEAAREGDGPRVSLDTRASRAASPSGPAREMVSFIVRDTGPGVSPQTLSRMFNPFFTTRPAGTGLGLAIVHRIVDAHQGRVRIRNNADDPAAGDRRGACVELQIPRALAGAEDPG